MYSENQARLQRLLGEHQIQLEQACELLPQHRVIFTHISANRAHLLPSGERALNELETALQGGAIMTTGKRAPQRNEAQDAFIAAIETGKEKGIWTTDADVGSFLGFSSRFVANIRSGQGNKDPGEWTDKLKAAIEEDALLIGPKEADRRRRLLITHEIVRLLDLAVEAGLYANANQAGKDLTGFRSDNLRFYRPNDKRDLAISDPEPMLLQIRAILGGNQVQFELPTRTSEVRKLEVRLAELKLEDLTYLFGEEGTSTPTPPEEEPGPELSRKELTARAIQLYDQACEQIGLGKKATADKVGIPYTNIARYRRAQYALADPQTVISNLQKLLAESGKTEEISELSAPPVQEAEATPSASPASLDELQETLLALQAQLATLQRQARPPQVTSRSGQLFSEEVMQLISDGVLVFSDQQTGVLTADTFKLFSGAPPGIEQRTSARIDFLVSVIHGLAPVINQIIQDLHLFAQVDEQLVRAQLFGTLAGKLNQLHTAMELFESAMPLTRLRQQQERAKLQSTLSHPEGE